MAKIIITKKLEEEINKLFKKESTKIFELMYSLQENPQKGKPVGQVSGIIIKELKYESYRFYFITDGFKVKVLQKEELNDLLIKFVRMSDKKSQQKVINEIKEILRKFGEDKF
jgi:mRNA-degrading endonuclease RelE of RelBE toxin-antitoxin system